MNAYRVLPAKRYPPHVESFLVCSSKTYQINSNYIYQARKRIITSNSKWACAAFETWNVGLSENGVPSNQLARLEPHFPNIKLHKFAINCIPHFESQLELSILLAIFISMYISVNYIPEYIYIYWLVVSTPLKNMKVSWDYCSQYMESHKIHVPNYQPDTHIYIIYPHSNWLVIFPVN